MRCRSRSGVVAGWCWAPLSLLLVSAAVGDGSRPGADSRGAILAAVQELFDAMAACDPEAAEKVLDPEARFYRVAGRQADERVSHFDGASFLEGLADCSRKRVERMWDPEVETHGGMAMVWAPYDFWLDGSLSHCGVNLLNLVDSGNGWEIVGGAYTFEIEGCDRSPQGPPAEEPNTE